jgi:septal ring factor EnvC (AmiA/AmiB activator)
MLPIAHRAAVLVLIAALALPLYPQAPQSSPPRRDRISSRERELAGLRAEIARLEGRLEAAKRRQSGLQDQLAAADLELKLQETRLAEAMTARDLAARRAAASELEVERLERAFAETRHDLQGRLAALYRLGRQGYLRLLLALDPDRPLLPSVRLIRYLARRDRQSMDRYRAARADLARERDRLVAERAERERWIASEEARRRELLAVRARRAELLARVRTEEQELSTRAGDLAERERKLAELLDLLAGESSGGPEGPPIQRFRGILDWPIEGKVTTGFGFRFEPRYHTRIPHHGIELATAPGGGVQAVFAGKVVFAAPFQGYGDTVILLHPGRVFTLYAGLSDLKVGREDMVSLGDVVGLSTDRLYFEIRVEKRPEDPMSWLRVSP